MKADKFTKNVISHLAAKGATAVLTNAQEREIAAKYFSTSRSSIAAATAIIKQRSI